MKLGRNSSWPSSDPCFPTPRKCTARRRSFGALTQQAKPDLATGFYEVHIDDHRPRSGDPQGHGYAMADRFEEPGADRVVVVVPPGLLDAIGQALHDPNVLGVARTRLEGMMLLDRAGENTTAMLRGLLGSLGYQYITLTFNGAG